MKAHCNHGPRYGMGRPPASSLSPQRGEGSRVRGETTEKLLSIFHRFMKSPEQANLRPSVIALRRLIAARYLQFPISKMKAHCNHGPRYGKVRTPASSLSPQRGEGSRVRRSETNRKLLSIFHRFMKSPGYAIPATARILFAALVLFPVFPLLASGRLDQLPKFWIFLERFILWSLQPGTKHKNL